MKAAHRDMLQLLASRGGLAFEDLTERQIPSADALVRHGFASRGKDGIYRITGDGRREADAQAELAMKPPAKPAAKKRPHRKAQVRADGETRALIRRLLEERPRTCAEVAEAAGVTTQTAGKHMRRLGASYQVRGGPWSLPASPAPEAPAAPVTPPPVSTAEGAPEASPEPPPAGDARPPARVSLGGPAEQFIRLAHGLDVALAVANHAGSFDADLEGDLDKARRVLVEAAVACLGGEGVAHG